MAGRAGLAGSLVALAMAFAAAALTPPAQAAALEPGLYNCTPGRTKLRSINYIVLDVGREADRPTDVQAYKVYIGGGPNGGRAKRKLAPSALKRAGRIECEMVQRYVHKAARELPQADEGSRLIRVGDANPRLIRVPRRGH